MKNSLGQLMLDVNQDVFLERMRQNEKWGVQRHENGRWLAILVEEVGESAEAMQGGTVSQKETDANNLYKELIQVAAVASAWAEQEKERLELAEMRGRLLEGEAYTKAPYMDLDDE